MMEKALECRSFKIIQTTEMFLFPTYPSLNRFQKSMCQQSARKRG